MFSLCVCDHVMIAHSLKGAVFGPAQRLHGATYVVEAEFRRAALDGDGLVIDIGLARRLLREVLDPLDYRNLDEVTELAGRNTTTEALARHVFDRLAARLAETDVDLGAGGLECLRVTLRESPVAWAAYEGRLGPA